VGVADNWWDHVVQTVSRQPPLPWVVAIPERIRSHSFTTVESGYSVHRLLFFSVFFSRVLESRAVQDNSASGILQDGFVPGAVEVLPFRPYV